MGKEEAKKEKRADCILESCKENEWLITALNCVAFLAVYMSLTPQLRSWALKVQRVRLPRSSQLSIPIVQF